MRMSISTTSARVAPGQLDRLQAGGRLADHLEVGGGVDQHPEAAAHQRLVVGEQHPDRHGVTALAAPRAGTAAACSGSDAVTR